MPSDDKIHFSLPKSFATGSLVVASFALISFLDYLTGSELSFFVFYYLPIFFIAWRHGVIGGILTSFIATAAWYWSYKLSDGAFSSSFVEYWNTGTRLIAFLVIAIIVSRLAREMKKLQSLLPLCGCCKKVRNDSGYWEKVEDYFRERARTSFSHSICPDCSDRLRTPQTLFVQSKTDEVFLLKNALVKAGLPHALHCVENTHKAMEWLSGGATYSDRKKYPMPDLVVIDAETEGEGSFKFVEWLNLQSNFRGIPVLFVDSFRESGKIQRAYQVGVASCFSKSAEYQELAEFLRTSHA